jgi:hypothetical protein
LWLLCNAAFFPVQPAHNEDKLQRKMISSLKFGSGTKQEYQGIAQANFECDIEHQIDTISATNIMEHILKLRKLKVICR